MLDFKKGKLPFKYLGFPRISNKLNMYDCEPLVGKITARIYSECKDTVLLQVDW